jgi:hypothetical protein
LPSQTIECAAGDQCTPVSFVLGQSNAESNTNLLYGMNTPYDALVVGSKLFIADCNNNRVVAWNSFPTTNQQPPDFVLGQPDFTTNNASYGGVSANSMSCPNSLAFGVDNVLNEQHLIVGDKNNGRIL